MRDAPIELRRNNRNRNDEQELSLCQKKFWSEGVMVRRYEYIAGGIVVLSLLSISVQIGILIREYFYAICATSHCVNRNCSKSHYSAYRIKFNTSQMLISRHSGISSIITAMLSTRICLGRPQLGPHQAQMTQQLLGPQYRQKANYI